MVPTTSQLRQNLSKPNSALERNNYSLLVESQAAAYRQARITLTPPPRAILVMLLPRALSLAKPLTRSSVVVVLDELLSCSLPLSVEILELRADRVVKTTQNGWIINLEDWDPQVGG